jgi:hypothetical protein
MKSARVTVLTTVTLFGLLTIPVDLAAHNANSKMITFEAPGADTTPGSFNGTGCFGCTFAINQWGAIAGTYVDANDVYQGFLRSPEGKFTTFQAPGADTTPGSYNGTVAQSINDFGEITGYYADATGLAHGFLRTRWGAFTSFDVPGCVNGAIPIFINLEGAVAGWCVDAVPLSHAFLRRPDGTFATFVGLGSCTSGFNGSPPCYGNEATYVDLFGRSVGNFEANSANRVGHGMIRSPGGKLTTFDAPGAGTGLYQGTGCPGCNLGVNLSGAIAGTYTDANNVFHGFLRSPEGKFTTFDATGAGTGSYQGTGCFSDCPVGLNDWGMITGSYFDTNNVQHGYLRTPEGTFVTVDPPGSVGTQPESINDSGAIVGYYLDANNVYHGFLRAP